MIRRTCVFLQACVPARTGPSWNASESGNEELSSELSTKYKNKGVSLSSYQHDVRAKQPRTCDTDRGFPPVDENDEKIQAAGAARQ